jgi:hypothetical protein
MAGAVGRWHTPHGSYVFGDMAIQGYYPADKNGIIPIFAPLIYGRMNLKRSLLLIGLLLFIDQLTKIYIKTHFVLGESVEVFSWFKILFIENEGAAWGTKLSDILPVSDSAGKLILTIFRLFRAELVGFNRIPGPL